MSPLTTISGSMKFGSEGKLDLRAIYDADPSRVTASNNESEKGKVLDGATGTYWYDTIFQGPYTEYPLPSGNWLIDLTQEYAISKIRTLSSSTSEQWVGIYIQCGTSIIFSLDYCHISSSANSPQWNETIANYSARYIQVTAQDTSLQDFDTMNIYELEIYTTPLTAIHTSSPSQIGATGDATRYVSEYQTFTPTESEPANSDITYRFCLTTSDGGSTGTWTDYIDYTGTAIDLTAQSALAITQTEIDAEETYLQVQSRLTSTDGVSTPTLSDYTASYHTNKAPTAPTAL